MMMLGRVADAGADLLKVEEGVDEGDGGPGFAELEVLVLVDGLLRGRVAAVAGAEHTVTLRHVIPEPGI